MDAQYGIAPYILKNHTNGAADYYLIDLTSPDLFSSFAKDHGLVVLEKHGSMALAVKG